MNSFRGFCLFLAGAALAAPRPAYATPGPDARPYVLYYEGTIGGDTALIRRAAQKALKGLDATKADSEFFFQNLPGSDQYVVEAAVQAKADSTEAYVRDFVGAHGKVAVGGVDLTWRPAMGLTEFLSLSAFGPGQAGGGEVRWGDFSRVRSFASLGDYTSAIVALGGEFDGGDFVRAVPSAFNPVDALIFLGWLEAKPPRKLSRFTLESHSFFAMEDGSYVSRAITWRLEKRLQPLPVDPVL